MDVVVESNVIELGAPRMKPSSEQLLLNGLLLLVSVVVVVIGLHAHVHEGLTAVNAVAFGLAIVWAVTGVVAARFSDRVVARVDVYATLIGLDALLASVALTVGRLAQNQPAHSYGVERAVATIAALLVTAVSFHFLLSLPDGQLPGRARRTAVIFVYVAALGTGLTFVILKEPFSLLEGGISWSIAALCALIPARLRYASAVGQDRDRLQWFAVGALISASIALVAAVLHVLLNHPAPLAIREMQRVEGIT